MVFTLPVQILQQRAYSSIFQDIIYQVKVAGDINATTGASIVGSGKSVPAGIILSLNANYDAGTATLHKGDAFVYVFVLKNTQGFQPKTTLISEYIGGSTDPSWTGELPVEDGDLLQMVVYNVNTNLKIVYLTGTMVKATQS